MAQPIKTVPPGAWDTHHHIFEPDHFPFSSAKHFTPSIATIEQLREIEASMGVHHVCIAHGLSFGPDCTSLLYYLEQFQGTARGICVIDELEVKDDVLEKHHAVGVRSVRLEFFKAEAMQDLQKQIGLIKATADRLLSWQGNGNGWSIQIQQPNLSHWEEIGKVASIITCRTSFRQARGSIEGLVSIVNVLPLDLTVACGLYLWLVLGGRH